MVTFFSAALLCLMSVSSAHAFQFSLDPFDWFEEDTNTLAPEFQEQTELAQEKAPKEPVPIDMPHAIEDLAYGDLLFDYYQQHYFSAITKILVAKERGQLDDNTEHADLVLGSLYVSYGMLEEGEAIFTRLLETHSSQRGADESWYQLARIHYKKGQPQKALDILTHNIVEPVESRQVEHLLLQVLSHIRLNQLDQARQFADYLKDEKDLSLFVRFNLGAAFAQLGEVERAKQHYQFILNRTPKTELDKTLRDQSALALGIFHLRNNELELAEQTLKQIRLYGPVANRALLALGWTYFHSDKMEDALTPWMELNDRPFYDPSVQESVLNVPFVYENLGALQDALDGYNSAYKTFRTQRRKLDDIKGAIMEPTWIENISPVDLSGQDVMAAVEQFQLPVKDSASPHLYRYFASNEFQRLYNDYREVQRLYMVLIHWERQFSSLHEMIATHVNRLNELAPQSEQAIKNSQNFYAYSRVKLQEFEAKLSEIIEKDDLMGLANSAQLAQKARLDAIEEALTALDDPDTYAEEWNKLKLLKGLLIWDLNALAIEKRWQATKDQIAIENLLVELEDAIRAVTNAREVRLNRFHGFETRIIDLRTRVTGLQNQVAQALRAQRNSMQKVAVGIIEQQQKQLDHMRAKALLSIARLQDLAYMQERQRKQKRDESILINLQDDESGQSSDGTSTQSSASQDGSRQYTQEVPVSEETSKSLSDVIKKIFSD